MRVCTSNGFKLAFNNLVGEVSFTVSKEFSNASNNIESCVHSELNFSCYDFAGFSVVLSSFGVSQDGPLQSEVLNVRCADFSSESASSSCRGVLDWDLNILLDVFLNPRDLERHWGNDNINLSRVEIELIKNTVYEVLGLSKGVVAFPVSTDKESSESHLSLFVYLFLTEIFLFLRFQFYQWFLYYDAVTTPFEDPSSILVRHFNLIIDQISTHYPNNLSS